MPQLSHLFLDENFTLLCNKNPQQSRSFRTWDHIAKIFLKYIKYYFLNSPELNSASKKKRQ